MDIQIGNTVMLRPLAGACQRTKNRIREHGSRGFVISGFNPGSWLFGNTPAVLLESVTETASNGMGGKESWKGWLPLLEIDDKRVS